jgi:hypothetical protein
MEYITIPKNLGGLGVHNLEVQNNCLLSKWLFKLLNEGNVAKPSKKEILV